MLKMMTCVLMRMTGMTEGAGGINDLCICMLNVAKMASVNMKKLLIDGYMDIYR